LSFWLKPVLSTIGTQAAAAIDVRDRRGLLALLRADTEDLHHERHVVAGLQPLQ
jgi:hypothetical protein